MSSYDEHSADMDAWAAESQREVSETLAADREAAHQHLERAGKWSVPSPDEMKAGEFDHGSLKAQSAAAHARLEGAIDGLYQKAARSAECRGQDIDAYRSALDRDGGPAPLEAKAMLDTAIRELLRDLISARKLADALGDPRSKRLVDALASMPGSGE